MHPINETVAVMVADLSEGLTELFNERAGIRQYDGQQQRELAEALALLDVIRMHPREACACWHQQ